MIRTLAGRFVFAVLFLLPAVTAYASVVYQLTLPANGDFDEIQIEITLPNYFSGPLTVLALDDPEVTNVIFGSPEIDFGFIGLDISATTTLIGVALGDDQDPFLLNDEYPDDFFAFNRGAEENGTFLATAGLLTAVPPFTLDDTTPQARLVVSGNPIPEPGSIVGFVTGAIALLAVRRLRRV